MGEWLKPADCKSAAPCGLRRFESSPVHHELGNGLIQEVGQTHNAVDKSGSKRLSSKARRARDEIGSRCDDPGKNRVAGTAGQSHEAMFGCGRKRGTSAVREKCAAKIELLSAQELAVDIEFQGERVHGFGLGSSVGRARPW